MEETVKMLSVGLINGLIPVIMALISWGLVALTNYIKQKGGNVALDQALKVLRDITFNVVDEMQKTRVEDLKKQEAFDLLTAAAVKEQAITQVLAQLAPPITKVLTRSMSDLSLYVSALIEAKLLNKPREF